MSARTRILVVAALALRCSGPPNRCLVSVPDPPARFLIPGEHAELRLRLGVDCQDAPEPRATQVAVEGFDPDNRSFAPRVSAPIHSDGDRPGSGADTVLVAWTADRPGPWRLLARFDPGFGQIDATVHAVLPRPDAPFHIIPAPFSAPCLQMGLTRAGTVLCSRRDGVADAELVTSRGQHIAGRVFAVAGNDVWRVGDGPRVLERLEDDGVQLRPTHRASISDDTFAVVADEEGVWTLTSPTGSPMSGVGPQLFAARAVADGGLTVERYALPMRWAAGMGIVGDGVDVLSTVDSSVVHVGRDGGMATRPGPIRTPQLLGSDGADLWVLGNGFAIRAWNAGLDATLPRTSRPPDQVVLTPFSLAIYTQNLPPGPAEPVACAFPAVRDAGIFYETYPAGDGFFEPQHATRTHVFAISRDGTRVKAFDR